MNTREILEEEYSESIIFVSPSYDDAIIGISEDERVIYSFDKMIECLVKADGMSPEDAEDFISYNTIRTLPYVGSKAPIVAYLF